MYIRTLWIHIIYTIALGSIRPQTRRPPTLFSSAPRFEPTTINKTQTTHNRHCSPARLPGAPKYWSAREISSRAAAWFCCSLRVLSGRAWLWARHGTKACSLACARMFVVLLCECVFMWRTDPHTSTHTGAQYFNCHVQKQRERWRAGHAFSKCVYVFRQPGPASQCQRTLPHIPSHMRIRTSEPLTHPFHGANAYAVRLTYLLSCQLPAYVCSVRLCIHARSLACVFNNLQYGALSGLLLLFIRKEHKAVAPAPKLKRPQSAQRA